MKSYAQARTVRESRREDSFLGSSLFVYSSAFTIWTSPTIHLIYPPPPLLRVGIQVNLKSLAVHFAWTLRRRQKSSPGTRIPPSYTTNKVKSASGRIVREDSRSCINALEYEGQSRYQIAWISDITRVSNWAEEVNNSTTVWNSGYQPVFALP